MPQETYNVQNTVTLAFISDAGGVPIEYETDNSAMIAATYYTTTTGVTHVVAGPHPKPH